MYTSNCTSARSWCVRDRARTRPLEPMPLHATPRLRGMCFDADASPPDLPADRAGNGGQVHARRLTLISADGTEFSATRAAGEGDVGVVILPDVRGLYPFYEQ